MADSGEILPTYSSLSSARDNSNFDDSSVAYIPILDFQRNEARSILHENDRHKSIYLQASLTKKYNPTERRRKRHRHSQTLGESTNTSSKVTSSNGTKDSNETDSPSARIQFLLGDEDQEDDDEEHKPHDLFIELNELRCDNDKSNECGEPTDMGWKETARWIKFEEVVETGGRWSKPHVASLSLHSLLELRNCILSGCVILDMQADQFSTIVDMILDTMIADESLPSEKRLITRNTLLLKHIHQHDKEFHRVSHTQESKKLLPFTHSFAELTRNRSQKDITPSIVDQMPPTTPTGTTSQHLTLTNRLCVDNQLKTRTNECDESGSTLSTGESRVKMNLSFMKKIPPNSEATNVLVGAVDFLQTPVYAFVRLAKGVTIPDLVEVPLPTRFVFILIGPSSDHLRYHEIGRSISTIMSDEVYF